jgi:hypothetical protein
MDAPHALRFNSADNYEVLPAVLNPRQRSLVRGSLLVLLSLGAAFFLSDFPHNRPTLLLLVPAVLSVVGTADTVRCMRRRWSFYHGGVILCIYMDLMAVTMILVFLLYPYALWLTSAH